MPLVFFLLSFSLSVIVPQARFFPLSTIRFCETTSFILLYMFFFVVFHFPYSLVQWQRMVHNVHSFDVHAILCVLIFFRFHSVYAYGKYFHVSAKFCALTKELHIHHHKAYFLYVYKTVEAAAASPKIEHTKLCDMCLIMNAYENSRSSIHKHTHIQFGDVTQNSDGNSNSHQKRYIMSKNFLYPPNDERKIKSSMKLQKV